VDGERQARQETVAWPYPEQASDDTGTMNLRAGVALGLVEGHLRALAILEAVGVELQGAGVLGDDAYLVVGVAVLLSGRDLDADL
jgi:hypothetical protein